MEAILCSSHSLPIPSFRNNRPTQRSTQLYSPTKQRLHQTRLSQSLVQTQAFSHVLSIAASSPASTGDISVLIPVSAVLLSFYWIANFIVPRMIEKDLQPGTEQSDEDTLEQSNISQEKKAGMPFRPSQKKKKGSTKKTASPR